MRIDDLLTVSLTAARLSLTREAVLAAIYRGTLKASLVGGRYLLTPSEVERYRAASLHKPGRRKSKPKETPIVTHELTYEKTDE